MAGSAGNKAAVCALQTLPGVKDHLFLHEHSLGNPIQKLTRARSATPPGEREREKKEKDGGSSEILI